MKKIQFILSITAAILTAQALQAQVSPVVLSKDASAAHEDGSYTLTLKSHLTGKLYDDSSAGATDIAILWDGSKNLKTAITTDKIYTEVSKPITVSVKSGTRKEPTITPTTKNKATAATPTVNPTVKTVAMSTVDRTAPKTTNWTYKNVTANTTGDANYSHFYKDENGDYYAMRKWEKLPNTSTGASNVYAIGYEDKNGNTWYLTSTGKSATYENVTSNTATLWNGILYKGWTYTYHRTGNSTDGYTYQCYGLDNGNANATVAKQWYYLHTDGEYYPVRRSATLPDGNGNNDVYGAWVEINGVTWYLHGDKLDTDYDRTMKSPYRAIWFAPLYKGGWTYDALVAANSVTNSKSGHYYLYTDNKYYPVHKATESVNGVTTYQAYIEVPGTGRLYLYGTNHLSSTPCPFSTASTIPMFFGPVTVGGWTYNNTNYDGAQQYYKHSDGEYYPVMKESGTFQLYVMVPEGKRYLDGNFGLSETPYAESTMKFITVFFGTLYNMTGWSQAGVTAATAGAGHYYKHSDDRYYPVLKETYTDPVTSAVTYQLYVEIQNGATPEQTVKRYLWGHSLHVDPCPYSSTTALIIWYGTLYKGGWSQASITVGNSGYSYLHPEDNEFYTIYRKSVRLDANRNIVSSGGTVTYQDCVTINGVEYYLYGNAISEAPYPYSTKKNSDGLGTVNNWFGPLYSGGWTYYNLTPEGTAENGLHYKHEGKYYPIKREDNGSGSTRYQAYITINGEKWYLYGRGLSRTKFPYSSGTKVTLFYGTLYYGGWTYNGITNGTSSGGQFYLHDGKYYGLVKKTINSKYQVQIGTTLDGEEMPGGPWYLAGSDISNTPYQYATTAKTTSLYFPALYQLKAYNKDVGLSNAINAFIEEVGDMSQQTGLEHRIALLQFGKNSWVYDNGTNILKPDLNQKTNASVAEVFYQPSKVNTDALVTSAKTQAAALVDKNASTVNTYHSYGLALARALFRSEGGVDETTTAGYDYGNTSGISVFEKSYLYGGNKLTEAQKTEYANRPKVVIIIGDGLNDQNETQAVAWASLLKNYSSGTMADNAATVSPLPSPLSNVKVYYVQIGASTPSQFVQSISSGAAYCRTSALYDEELETKLIEIAREIGGNVVTVGGTAVVQDVVAPEFEVPEGSTVEMFTSRWQVHESESTARFDDEEDWEPFNGTVLQTSNPDGTTTIQVSGFDFDANWCGDHGVGIGEAGKQLIVRIRIKPKNLTVGGTLATNTADSKLLDGDGHSLGVYPIPYISGLPITITIAKSGLRTGDSAIFIVRRKLRNGSAANYDTTPFMKVILTGTDALGTTVTANLVKLDPAYHYLVEEGDWSWTYTPTVNSISTEQQTTNPFEFGNTARSGILYDYGESEAHKVF